MEFFLKSFYFIEKLLSRTRHLRRNAITNSLTAVSRVQYMDHDGCDMFKVSFIIIIFIYINIIILTIYLIFMKSNIYNKSYPSHEFLAFYVGRGGHIFKAY